jgi:hypothetical protein
MINIGMRLIELFNNLLEYDHQITLTKQGPQLKVAYDKNEFDSSLAGGEVESSEILTRLEQMDPTVNKMYMLWIVRQYMNSKMRLEDYPQVFGGLEAFHKAKPRLPVEQRDINRFDLHQLYELVDSFSDTQQEPSNDTKLNRDDVEVIYNGPLGTIASPKTEEASCELGSGTKWCTVGKQNNMFHTYADSPLIIFQAPGGAKYQFNGKPDSTEGNWKFDAGFVYTDDNAHGYDNEGNQVGEWAWPPKINIEVANAQDHYLDRHEVKELYAKNPVLQKYLPLPDKAPDAKVHQEEFKQFIKSAWMAPIDFKQDRGGELDVGTHIGTYEKYFGPLKLERDINFEKQVIDNRIAFINGSLDKTREEGLEDLINTDRSEAGPQPEGIAAYVHKHLFDLEEYMTLVGMGPGFNETWPELEKIILNTLKVWHSKAPDQLAKAYATGFSDYWSGFNTGHWEFLATMPSVLNYLKSIGLSKAA